MTSVEESNSYEDFCENEVPPVRKIDLFKGSFGKNSEGDF